MLDRELSSIREARPLRGGLPVIIETRALRRWLSFALAGLTAFGVDMSVLGMLVHGLEMAPLRARLISIPLAASTAWLINRRFTFVSGDDRARWHQWLRYLAVNTVNVIVNYGCYLGLVSATAIGAAHPLLSVVPGALVGLWGNYLLAGRWVFRDPNLSSGR
ncbi:GtrA family protein [Salinisphaera sp. LB1]|uniref:GtrA family protein n=1 Tax=Salinisphaera sp. LB1 TaxID=2183911 RepID=UPI000D707EDA|nr:GtrA family protein [Salinisphaera sp. LB1]